MKLVLLRHGQSFYNKEKRFCGWTDSLLTETGINEAKTAGKILKENKISFDIAYTSFLTRATTTLNYVLDEMNLKIPVHYDWRINERCYGALQGKTHDEIEKKYGKEQVHLWRRSYDGTPPLLTIDDIRYPGNDPKYKNIPKEQLPLGESLKDTLNRTVSFYKEMVVPKLLLGNNVLIVAHGNSLRALIKYLEKISDEEITKIELKTGVPYVYDLTNDLNIKNKYFLKKVEEKNENKL